MKDIADLIWCISHPMSYYKNKEFQRRDRQLFGPAAEHAQVRFEHEARKPTLKFIETLSPEQRAAQGFTLELIDIAKNATLHNLNGLRKQINRPEQQPQEHTDWRPWKRKEQTKWLNALFLKRTSETTAICPKCDAELQKVNQFCPGCGVSLSLIASPEPHGSCLS